MRIPSMTSAAFSLTVLLIGMSTILRAGDFNPDADAQGLLEQLRNSKDEIIRKLGDRPNLAKSADSAPKEEKSSAGIQSCSIQPEDFTAQDVTPADLKGWTVFFRGKSGGSGSPNSFGLCVNGRQMINENRFPYDVRQAGDDLIVEAVTPADFIDPTALQEGWSLYGNTLASGARRFRVYDHVIFYIPTRNLAPGPQWQAMPYHRNVTGADVREIARVERTMDSNGRDTLGLIVNLFGAGPDEAAEMVARALREFMPGVYSGQDAWIIQSWVKTEAGKTNSRGSYVTIKRYERDVAAFEKELGPRDSQEVASFPGGDKLVYCHATHDLQPSSSCRPVSASR